MLKKMMLLAVSACALVAVAAPAVAQAQQLYTLYGESHQQLKKGAKVTATASSLVTGWGGVEWECTNATINGEVLSNKAPSSDIGIESMAFKTCQTKTNMWIEKITLKSEESGMATGVTYEVNVLGGTCRFEGNILFSYKHDTDTLTITGDELYDYYQPACGHVELRANYNLTTPTGTPVYIE